jgi:F-type H+-transporting ATPase subunit b
MKCLLVRSALAAGLAGALLLAAPAGAAFAQEDDGGHETADAHGDDHGLSIRDVVSNIQFQGALVNFCLLLALFIYMGRKPVSQYFEGRKKQIEEDLEEAARLKAAAEAKFEEYSSRLEQLDDELDQIRKDLAEAGEKERDRIVAEAEGKAARLRKDTEFVIEQQMKHLRDELTHAAVSAAVAAAREVLTKETSASDQQKLADAYLERFTDRVSDAIDTQGGA